MALQIKWHSFLTRNYAGFKVLGLNPLGRTRCFKVGLYYHFSTRITEKTVRTRTLKFLHAVMPELFQTVQSSSVHKFQFSIRGLQFEVVTLHIRDVSS